jgi:hypothetical protein
VLFAQQQNFSLEKGSCAVYKQHVYAYGFKNNSFVIYKLKPNLQVVDSLYYNLDKSKAIDHLGVECDTLHETLNFRLQKKDKQNVTLLRLDATFKLINEFKNTEVTKLDPFATFDHQKFAYKKFVYAVKTAIDTSGKQYYLSKYELQNSSTKPFDYKFKWQFNFEKKHIKNVRVFYADTMQVLAFVHINNGERKGQWVIKINASTGLIVKAKKISSNVNLSYRYSNHFVDTVSKNVFILGQLTNGEQLASPTPTLFILQFDSMHTLNSQKQLIQRITSSNPKVKTPSTFVFQIGQVKKKSPDTYEYQIDFYKNNSIDFKYSNTSMQSFSFTDDAIETEPSVIKEFPEIENYFFTTDKKDLNGKLFVDTAKSTDRLFYEQPVFKVKQAFKLNDNEFPIWILKKTDIKTSSINFSALKPGLKTYELKAITTNQKEEDPGMLFFGKSDYVVFYSKNGNILHLEVGNW